MTQPPDDSSTPPRSCMGHPGGSGTSVSISTDVPYGEPGENARLLDVFRPPGRNGARPAVLVLHGGGWTAGGFDRRSMAAFAQHLAEAGYVVFNATYRLMTGEPGVNAWPSQLHDVQRAVR